MSTKTKKTLVLIAFILFSIGLVSIFNLFMSAGEVANIAFAYAVGLTMIVLPCTLPLAFVIVPMAMNKSAKKGLIMALLFGLGISITLAIYGLFVATVGNAIGLDEAVGNAGSVSKILFMIGGLSAFIFGLSELDLISFKLPSYRGAYPKIIQNHGDYLKSLFLGIFLGNAGVGCPNPLFYVLLGDIAIAGSVSNGMWFGFVHGIGRATPLIFLAILGILGVNAVSGIASKTKTVTKWTGISLVFLGSFIFISGASHQWYEQTPVHRGWNKTIEIITGENSGVVEMEDHDSVTNVQDTHTVEGTPKETPIHTAKDHEDGKDFIPAPWSWIVLLTMSIVPIVWYYRKEKQTKEKQGTNESI